MADGGKLLGLITARGGSVRTPNKNARPFAGSSLIGIALREALAATELDLVGLSTDSKAYLALAREAGLHETYLRPGAIAGPDATSASCVLDYVQWLETQGGASVTHVATLQPTSPFRTASQIDAAIRDWRASGRASLVSAKPAAPAPGHVLSVNRETGAIVREGADGQRDFLVLDGAIYITPLAMLRDHGRFWDEDSAIFVTHYPRIYDIDAPEDFDAAEAIMRGN